MIRIELSEPFPYTKIRKWCKKQFGPIPLILCHEINPKIRFKLRHHIKYSGVYDEKNARWLNRGSYKKKDTKHIFYFKNEEDAFLFSVTWL